MSCPLTLHAADAVDQIPNHNDPMGCTRFSTSAPGDECSVTGASVGAGNPDVPIGVLVVDDDPRVRAALTLTIALEPDLAMVAAVAGPADALAWAEHADPGVVLVDVFLPDATTGLALVRRLAQRSRWAVVAMSVRGGLRPAALAAGAASFVEKGGDIDAVLDAVRAAASPRHA
jgi:DNA-binding NtrC family response regulator